jgi:hypothetical protein
LLYSCRSLRRSAPGNTSLLGIFISLLHGQAPSPDNSATTVYKRRKPAVAGISPQSFQPGPWPSVEACGPVAPAGKAESFLPQTWQVLPRPVGAISPSTTSPEPLEVNLRSTCRARAAAATPRMMRARRPCSSFGVGSRFACDPTTPYVIVDFGRHPWPSSGLTHVRCNRDQN